MAHGGRDIMNITRCEGDGQGVCIRCIEVKKLGTGAWNWMTMLYKIEGLEGHYCSQCVAEIKAEQRSV